MSTGNRHRILIADDEESLRFVLRELLTREGCDVDEAADGQEAIDKASMQGYDLYVLDMKMPRQDGLAVLRSIRKKYPQALVVMVTAYGSQSLALDALTASVGERALVALAAAGADRDDRRRPAGIARAKLREQIVALRALVLIGLVQCDHERLAEACKPGELGILRSRQVRSADVDDCVRAQSLVACDLLTYAAVDLAAAGHVGEHEPAPVGQHAVVLRDGSRASVLRVRADGDAGALDPTAEPQGETIEDTDLATDLATALLATLEPGDELALPAE